MGKHERHCEASENNKTSEIIEKHIGLENQKKGLDLDFSLRGKEILRFRKDITETYRLLGRNSFVRKKSELKNLRFRRSLFVVKDIKKGEKFTKFNIRSLRPNIGLSPVNIKRFIGKKSKIDIKSNTSITKKLIRKILV